MSAAKKRAWYEANRDRILAREKERYKQKREALLAYQRQYRANNVEALKDKARRYYEANKADWKARRDKAYAALKATEAGREKIRAKGRQKMRERVERLSDSYVRFLLGGPQYDHLIPIKRMQVEIHRLTNRENPDEQD